MSFLSGIIARVLEWFLEKIGRALYEYANDIIEKYKQKQIDKENTKKHKEDIVNNAPPEQKGKSGRKLINGEDN